MEFRVRIFRVLLGVSVALLALPLCAAPIDDVVEIHPSDNALYILIDDLLINDGSATLADLATFEFSDPSYGTLRRVGDQLVYEPIVNVVNDLGFWNHGTDSFTYSTRLHRKEAPSTATVFLTGVRFGSGQFAWDFEDGVVPDLDDGFEGAVHGGAAQTGQMGLELTFDLSPFSDSKSVLEFRGGDPNTTTNTGSGCASGKPDPLDVIWELVPQGITLLGAGPENDPFRIRMVMREGLENFEVRGEAVADNGIVRETPWWPLTAGPHTFELDWWLKTDTRSAGGFMVRVDDVVVGRLNDVLISGDFEQSSVIGVDSSAEGTGTLLLDDVILASGEGQTYRPIEPLRLDGFEGSLMGWSNAGFTTATIEPTFAITGQRSLHADLTDPNVPYVTDTTPSEREYGMRFRLDPRGAVLPTGTRVIVFSASSDEPGAGTGHHLWLKVRDHNGQRQIRAQQGTDTAGVYASSPWVAVPQYPFMVEMDWRGATDLQHENGRLRLWLNGILAIEMNDLATHSKRIETIRLGVADTVGSGVGGLLYVDDFQSWGVGAPPPTVPPI